MPVTPDCPQATIALLMSQASTHRSAADMKVLRRCGAAAVKLAEASGFFRDLKTDMMKGSPRCEVNPSLMARCMCLRRRPSRRQ
jgi:hypothetical protein